MKKEIHMKRKKGVAVQEDILQRRKKKKGKFIKDMK